MLLHKHIKPNIKISVNITALIGESIVCAKYNNDSIYLISKNEKVFILSPNDYGDEFCYITRVLGSKALINSTIFSIRYLTIDDSENDFGDKSDEWVYDIFTTRGIFSIELRLECKDFYGGDIGVQVFSIRDIPHIVNYKPLCDF